MIKPPPRYIKFKQSKLDIGKSFLEDFRIVNGLKDKASLFHPRAPLDYFRKTSGPAFGLIPKWIKLISSSDFFEPSSPAFGRTEPSTSSSFNKQFRCTPKSSNNIWLYNFSNGNSTLRNLREEEEKYRHREAEIKAEPEEETVIDLISLKKKKVKRDEGEGGTGKGDGKGDKGDFDKGMDKDSDNVGSGGNGNLGPNFSSSSGLGSGSGSDSGSGSGPDLPEFNPILTPESNIKSSKKRRKRGKLETVIASNFSKDSVTEVPAQELRKSIKVPTKSLDDFEVEATEKDGSLPESQPQGEIPIDNEKLSNDTFSPLQSTIVDANAAVNVDSVTTGEDLLKGLHLNEKYKDSSRDFERLLSLVEIEADKKYGTERKKEKEKLNVSSNDKINEDILPDDIRSKYEVSKDSVLEEATTPTQTAAQAAAQAPTQTAAQTATQEPEQTPTQTPTQTATQTAPTPEQTPTQTSPTPEQTLTPPTQPLTTPIQSNDIHDLQNALKEAKADGDKHRQEMFRIENAFEYSKSVASKRPRSIEKGNFFTPIDRPIAKPQSTKKGVSYEYIIVTPNQKFIRTRSLPFKDDHPRRDLFSALSEMPDPAKYVKTIAKLEKANWKCIGGGGPGRLLVFEREYNSTKRFTKFLFKFTVSFVSIISAAAFVAVMIESPFAA